LDSLQRVALIVTPANRGSDRDELLAPRRRSALVGSRNRGRPCSPLSRAQTTTLSYGIGRDQPGPTTSGRAACTRTLIHRVDAELTQGFDPIRLSRSRSRHGHRVFDSLPPSRRASRTGSVAPCTFMPLSSGAEWTLDRDWRLLGNRDTRRPPWYPRQRLRPGPLDLGRLRPSTRGLR